MPSISANPDPRVKFNRILDPLRYPLNPTKDQIDESIADIEACARVRLIRDPGTLIDAYANGSHYRQKVFNVWSNPDPGKYWFQQFSQAFDGVFFKRNPDLSYMTEPIANTMQGMQWTHIDFYNFVRSAYSSHFALQVPWFEKLTVNWVDAERTNWVDGPGVDYPLAVVKPAEGPDPFRSSFPPDIAIAIRQDQAWWFRISEYRSAYPLTTVIQVPPGGVGTGGGAPADPAQISRDLQQTRSILDSQRPAAERWQGVRGVFVKS